MAVPVLWSTAEEFLGKRWGRRYRKVQVRCWRTAAVVRSAQVPGPEPGLGESRGRHPWAREQGAPLAVPAREALMPLPRKGWPEECQLCALFLQGQKPSKRVGTSLGLANIYLGNFGFPGIFAGFSNRSSIG